MRPKTLAAILALTLALDAHAARAEDVASAPGHHHTAAPWIVVGAGGATLVIGILSFVGAVKASSDAATEARASGCTTSPSVVCPTGYDPSHLAGLVDGEHAMNWLGAIFSIAGGGAVIGGLLWHLLEPNKIVVVRPMVGPNATSISLAVRF